jgi:hypothetical protein
LANHGQTPERYAQTGNADVAGSEIQLRGNDVAIEIKVTLLRLWRGPFSQTYDIHAFISRNDCDIETAIVTSRKARKSLPGVKARQVVVPFLSIQL